MHILCLTPSLNELRLALYDASDAGELSDTKPVFSVRSLRGVMDLRTSLSALLKEYRTIDLVAIYTPQGGDVFPHSEVVKDDNLAGRFETLEHRAPIHAPAARAAAEAVARELPGTPVIVVTGTGFFSSLPQRERLYAIDGAMSERHGLIRTGFHGLFHAAAMRCSLSHRPQGSSWRTLSICLEPRPEAVALLADVPVMVTGGATPLEGLPGQTTCGEIDPGLVLLMAQKQHWSPEQIGTVLSRESGLLGLAGRPVNLTELFESDDKDLVLAREVILYRLLQATGMALAALGGLDAIVFTGRHANVGAKIGVWLKESLAKLPSKPSPRIEIVSRHFESLMLEEAYWTWLQQGEPVGAC